MSEENEVQDEVEEIDDVDTDLLDDDDLGGTESDD
jgi:hypothetical protein